MNNYINKFILNNFEVGIHMAHLILNAAIEGQVSWRNKKSGKNMGIGTDIVKLEPVLNVASPRGGSFRRAHALKFW